MRPFIVVALALVLPFPLSSQVVEGRVRSATTGRPLPGASVRLVDQTQEVAGSAVSDHEGRFRVTLERGGTYVAVVESEGYASTLSPRLLVTAGETAHLVLTVRRVTLAAMSPSRDPEMRRTGELQAVAKERCGLRGASDASAVVAGHVVDAESGVGLPGATVNVSWSSGDGGLHVVQVTSDLNGVYVLCDLPEDQEARLRAEAVGVRSEQETLTLDRGFQVRDLALALGSGEEPGYVIGRVHDFDTQEPIEAADVRLRDTDFHTLSDMNGFFRFEDVPRGLYVLEAEHLGHASRQRAFQVVGGAGHQIDVVLPNEAIPMPPMTVTVRSRRWFHDRVGLQTRMASGAGHFILGPQLLARSVSRLVDVLYGLPGVMVRRIGRFASVRMRGRACDPSVFLDGRPHMLDREYGLNVFYAGDIEVIEIYGGPAETPPEFAYGGACGTLVLWTRRGR